MAMKFLVLAGAYLNNIIRKNKKQGKFLIKIHVKNYEHVKKHAIKGTRKILRVAFSL